MESLSCAGRRQPKISRLGASTETLAAVTIPNGPTRTPDSKFFARPREVSSAEQHDAAGKCFGFHAKGLFELQENSSIRSIWKRPLIRWALSPALTMKIRPDRYRFTSSTTLGRGV